jgi:poly(beta-D-mannuronate) lyase
MLRSFFPALRLLFAGLLCVAAARLSAAPAAVADVAALQKAIHDAAPGARIVVKKGTYTTSEPILVTCAGTAEHPIVIAAESVGGVEIAGTNGFKVVKPAAYVVIEGFSFTHQAAHGDTIEAGTQHVRFTRNTFHCSGEGAEIDVSGDNAEVDHNEFRDKKVIGNMISVTGVQPQVARGLWIHHNYFHDYANAHANGAETIRFGRSFFSMSNGNGLVEYNLFERCVGENELITNKSCGNTYRYNTFVDSPGAQLTLRHGNDCVVYGNYFRKTDGLRIFGDRQQVFSNYFEDNTTGISLGNGDGEVADGSQLTCHDRPDNGVIAFNTFVNNKTNIVMIKREKNALGATHTTFANNLIVGGAAAATIEGPNPGAVWSTNLVWKVDAPGSMPAEGFKAGDPLFAAETSGGTRHLQAKSPAIDAAAGDFAFANVDMDGQPRTGKKDIGADELSDAPIKARPLTAADVGPAAQ